mmetsp:Transcript_53615/g.125512  ORF Transcript_53615/g.125512 Transcript_53615/m.125512 type:complete len:204 (-) Transcript_53615:110-721(-)
MPECNKEPWWIQQEGLAQSLRIVVLKHIQHLPSSAEVDVVCDGVIFEVHQKNPLPSAHVMSKSPILYVLGFGCLNYCNSSFQVVDNMLHTTICVEGILISRLHVQDGPPRSVETSEIDLASFILTLDDGCKRTSSQGSQAKRPPPSRCVADQCLCFLKIELPSSQVSNERSSIIVQSFPLLIWTFVLQESRQGANELTLTEAL